MPVKIFKRWNQRWTLKFVDFAADVNDLALKCDLIVNLTNIHSSTCVSSSDDNDLSLESDLTGALGPLHPHSEEEQEQGYNKYSSNQAS